MIENIAEDQEDHAETLAERPDLVEQIARESIGRDLEVEAMSWVIRGPIRRIIIKDGEHVNEQGKPLPSGRHWLYFELEWIAEEVGWAESEVGNSWKFKKPDPKYGNKVVITTLDGIWPIIHEDGSYYLIAPGAALATIQIHPSGDNLRKEDLISP